MMSHLESTKMEPSPDNGRRCIKAVHGVREIAPDPHTNGKWPRI